MLHNNGEITQKKISERWEDKIYREYKWKGGWNKRFQHISNGSSSDREQGVEAKAHSKRNKNFNLMKTDESSG